jgi:hypothetical protein
MIKNYFRHSLLAVFFIIANSDVLGQTWDFAKEEDGIKIFTRNQKNSSLKSYRGEMILHAPFQKVCSMFGNANNIDWWGPDFKSIKVLAYVPGKYVQFYYIYDMPWPLIDRDLAVNVTVNKDTATGEYSFQSTPLLNVIPEKPNLVRIKKYSQKWTVKPLEKGNVLVILEGFVDPDVPSWLYNILVAEMPVRTMRLLRERVLSNKPANP